MAHCTIPHDFISWATATLIHLTDDDILRHEEEFQRLVTRITRVIACPSGSAETILEIARANIGAFIEFIAKTIPRQYLSSATLPVVILGQLSFQDGTPIRIAYATCFYAYLPIGILRSVTDN